MGRPVQAGSRKGCTARTCFPGNGYRRGPRRSAHIEKLLGAIQDESKLQEYILKLTVLGETAPHKDALEGHAEVVEKLLNSALYHSRHWAATHETTAEYGLIDARNRTLAL